MSELVINEETGKPVKVDQKRQQLGFALHQKIEAATLITAMALTKISEDKLYLDMGFASFKDYTEVLPFGERSAKSYLAIGRRFQHILPEISSQQGKPVSLLTGETDEFEQDEAVQSLSSLGLRKLKAIAQMDDTDLTDIPVNGNINLADGSCISIEEIRSQSVAQAERMLRERRRKYMDQIKSAEERARLAESERDGYKQRADQAEKEKEQLVEYRDKYEKAGLSIELAKKKLAKIQEHIIEINRLQFNADIDEEVQLDLHETIRQVHWMLDTCRNNFKERNLRAFEPGLVTKKVWEDEE